MENSKKFLCLEVSKYTSKFGVKDPVTGDEVVPVLRPVPDLCKCPANPEMLMAALQFLTDDMVIQVRVSEEPIDFFNVSSDK